MSPETTTLSDVQAEFVERAHRIVWCSVATVDGQGRPRSRILHPIWEGEIGWIGTRRDSLKAKHLARNPYVSVAYVADMAKPAYAECVAEWVDDVAQKRRIWELFENTPKPLGYEPGPIFGHWDAPTFGLLKLTPWRIQLDQFPAPSRVWRREGDTRG